MKLTHISKLTGIIELITGLHIGSGNAEMHIGGTDNPVIKNPISSQPYIPGSSLKGKMRSLMEWRAGVVAIADGKPLGLKHLSRLDDAQRPQGELILKLFGGAPEGDMDEELQKAVRAIGPTRLAFWDCSLNAESVKRMEDLMWTETKMENAIDRIRGVAEHPRNTERVPAGAMFDFNLTIRIHDEEDLLDEVLRGLKLIELTGLGGSGSRGYGKVRFDRLSLDGADIGERYAAQTL